MTCGTFTGSSLRNQGWCLRSWRVAGPAVLVLVISHPQELRSAVFLSLHHVLILREKLKQADPGVGRRTGVQHRDRLCTTKRSHDKPAMRLLHHLRGPIYVFLACRRHTHGWNGQFLGSSTLALCSKDAHTPLSPSPPTPITSHPHN